MKTFSQALEKALRIAFRCHDGHMRKSDPGLPYMTHLVHVACIVQAHGFSDEVVIAALLHDTIEDTEYTPEELARDFGDPVCSIVMEVTENKSLRWEERKSAYLEGIRNGSVAAKAVCCADKLHNLSAILSAEEEQGDALWEVFTKGRERTMRFYEEALSAIGHGWEHPLLDAYRAVLENARQKASR